MLLNLDPFFFLFYPNHKNILIIVVRYVLTMITVYINAIVLLLLLTIFLIGLSLVFLTVKACYNLTMKVVEVSMEQKTDCASYFVEDEHRKIGIRSLIVLFKVLKNTTILINVVTEGVSNFLPFGIILAEVLLVALNVASVKIYDYAPGLPIPFYLVCPLLAINLAVHILALFPPAANVYEYSIQLVNILKGMKMFAKSKYLGRKFYSENLPKFKIGTFFYVKRSTKTTFLWCCITDTLNCLLLI